MPCCRFSWSSGAASSSTFVAAPWAVAYSASKFVLRGMSDALRAEVSDYPEIHICDVYPTFVDTPGIRHAGNYTGGRLSVPPGALDPRTVAKAVVRLADHPKKTTALGAPAALMRAAQLVAPNSGPHSWSRYSRQRAALPPTRPDG